MPQSSQNDREELSLPEAAKILLEECRMVLPGIQALFGFQMVAVFNQRFAESLAPWEQQLHMLAIGLVMVSIGLVMAPAAFHRQTGPMKVSSSFIRLATAMLLIGMVPLAVALCIDFVLVARVIGGASIAWIAGGCFIGFYLTFWVIVPQIGRKKER